MLEAGHQLVQIENPGLEHLAAAEGQELLGERRGALPGLHDLFHRMAVAISGGEAVQDELAVAGDDGQQVIEIVRHAAGQHPHGFHLLRLAELLFQAAAAGNVVQDGQFGPATSELDVVNRHFHVEAAVLVGAVFPHAGEGRFASQLFAKRRASSAP